MSGITPLDYYTLLHSASSSSSSSSSTPIGGCTHERPDFKVRNWKNSKRQKGSETSIFRETIRIGPYVFSLFSNRLARRSSLRVGSEFAISKFEMPIKSRHDTNSRDYFNRGRPSLRDYLLYHAHGQ